MSNIAATSLAQLTPMACAVEHPDVACVDNQGRDALLVVGGIGKNDGKVGFGISEENISNGIFDRYDCVFLVIEDEDNYSGEAENLPEALCVSVRFCGVHNDAAQRYEQLTEYMKKNGLRAAGFSREITLVDYGMTNDTKKFVTEIKIPVVPKDWFEKILKIFRITY